MLSWPSLYCPGKHYFYPGNTSKTGIIMVFLSSLPRGRKCKSQPSMAWLSLAVRCRGSRKKLYEHQDITEIYHVYIICVGKLEKVIYFFFVFGSFGAAKIQIQGRFSDSEIAKAHTDTVTKFSDSVAGAVARFDFWRENQRTRITIRFFSVLFWPGNHTHLLGFRPLPSVTH